MKTRIDLKRAPRGTAVGAGASSNGAGRYQVFTAENVALVLDTQTGKVWAKGWSSTSDFKNGADLHDPKLSEPK
jgi:hypothetical protein